MRDIEVYSCNDEAMSAVTSYEYVFYISMAIMIILLYAMQQERENKMWQLIHTCNGGRIKLALKRIVILAVGSLLVVGINYGSVVFAAFWLNGGLETLQAPIQNIVGFEDCIMKINMPSI